MYKIIFLFLFLFSCSYQPLENSDVDIAILYNDFSLFLNEITYLKEFFDFWQTFELTSIRKTGDCEDIVIYCMVKIYNLYGIKSELAVFNNNNTGLQHAVLIINSYVFDSQAYTFDEFLLRGYTFLYSLDYDATMERANRDCSTIPNL